VRKLPEGIGGYGGRAAEVQARPGRGSMTSQRTRRMGLRWAYALDQRRITDASSTDRRRITKVAVAATMNGW